MSAQVGAFHSQFVQTLNSGAAAYAGTEAACVQQNLLDLLTVTSPSWR
nr:PE family protein [Mycobacterium gastri]